MYQLMKTDMRILKLFIIRWAVKKIKQEVKPEMTYYTLSRYGIEDIMKIAGGENAYIF